MHSQWLGLGAYEWRAEDYISFVCKFMLGMGLGFELPVVLLTLVKLGVLNYTMLRSMWRYMIVINLILGALLTTPEVLTQVLMAVPLYMLYEITVWIAGYWDRDGNNWAWREGRWDRPEHRGARWIAPVYRREHGGTRYEGGHWSNQRVHEGDEYHRWRHDHQD